MPKPMNINEVRGSSVYDIYRDNMGYIHLCFIDMQGRGRQLQFSEEVVLDAKDNFVDLDGLRREK